MQVNVQKFTTTTRPSSPAGSSGSELIHSAAPASEGVCKGSDTGNYLLRGGGMNSVIDTRRPPPSSRSTMSRPDEASAI